MNRVKELREAMGWTQTDLGKKLNVKAAAISKYEKGDVSLTDETLTSLSAIFEVSTDYILCLTDDPIPARDVNQDLMDDQDIETKWTNFLAQLPEDQAMHYQGVTYPDDQKIVIMEEAAKAKQKKLKKIEKFMKYPVEVIDDALIYAAFDAEQRKKMNEEN